MLNTCIGLLLLLILSPSLLADNILKLEIALTKTGGKGTVLIQLLPQKAPNHIKRIKQLVDDGAYDNVAFHRVIEGFMAQTGDVKYGNMSAYDKKNIGTGGSSYSDLYAELSNINFDTGVVGMARNRYVHSANSQFFIMTAPHQNLNGSYTVIGIVKEGLKHVRKLRSGSRDVQGKVERPDYIIKASII